MSSELPYEGLAQRITSIHTGRPQVHLTPEPCFVSLLHPSLHLLLFDARGLSPVTLPLLGSPSLLSLLPVLIYSALGKSPVLSWMLLDGQSRLACFSRRIRDLLSDQKEKGFPCPAWPAPVHYSPYLFCHQGNR